MCRCWSRRGRIRPIGEVDVTVTARIRFPKPWRPGSQICVSSVPVRPSLAIAKPAAEYEPAISRVRRV